MGRSLRIWKGKNLYPLGKARNHTRTPGFPDRDDASKNGKFNRKAAEAAKGAQRIMKNGK